METLNWDDFITNEEKKPFAATIGVFDGVHRGHQALIERVVRQRKKPTVITFRQNPKQALARQGGKNIISLEEKLDIFEKMGITRTILIDFSENFSKMEGQVFIETLLNRGLSFLAVGENFRCGYHRDTNVEAIRRITAERGVEINIVPPLLLGERPISSSMIREAIERGDFVFVSAALGREFKELRRNYDF
ncbi:MAG: FAD synthetase family protein [Treponema sp.]|jgi:riboflavin kinase/FMN adenylyltransferase|nr:FAD synthetase family protein [Treponema sp.]